ncbi:hypothetical protein ACFQ49_16015 [Kroppenstedtia eburnea]|uniref:Uncharacterized protein n=1 Tax=Kroppenstedtia eburnea TaxID=714067 RepID=A0A1N7JF10_9BACL|nr:hypothetical protein [Kroppenstedtia eburnea]SIS47943.1 hypothetical protein SAMN05421790_10217 [Kroppenstedtia eburnea]
MHRLAWHAANLMNVHLKKKVTVKKLLGQERNMAQTEREQQFARLMQARQGEGGQTDRPIHL